MAIQSMEVGDSPNSVSPKFSIVIPTIGRLDLIRRALYSALRQQDHFDDYEIVVLDNCSEDGTWDYLQGINNPRLKIFRNSHRLSQAQNYNKAVRLSSGEFVYMLEDDNVVLPEMLATISDSMARHENVDLVCFAIWFMNEDERDQVTGWQPEREELLPATQALMGFGHKWFTNASHMVFSRAVYDRYGEFDESPVSPILSDLEYILRWLIHCNTLIIPDVLAMHRIWSGTALVTTQHSPEMFTMLTHTINRVLRFAADSGRLDPDQLEDLRQTLVQVLLVDFLKRPVEDMFKRPRN
jgi:glycosyltransferase involved in cell wall biosynthesis